MAAFDLPTMLRDCTCSGAPVGNCTLHGAWDDRGKPRAVETDPFLVDEMQEFRAFGTQMRETDPAEFKRLNRLSRAA